MPASILAGALLGVALYSYAAAYALPFVVGLSILAFWLSTKRAERPAIRQFITYSLAFALVILPLFIFALESPDFFGLHLETTAASSSMTVVENIGGTLGGIFLNGDRFSESIDVNLVELPVSVSDTTGAPVVNLEQKDFQVLENGKPVKIASFSALVRAERSTLF